MWNEYLIKNNIDHIFFSAMQQIKANEIDNDNESETTLETNENSTIHQYINSSDILSVTNLINLLELYKKEFNQEKIQVGMVGYPNVGKSSVINALFGKKKVAVASMPGKTKHFQTLTLSDTVTLCDCPGLVFPRISSSEAEMILNGLYPVDNLKNFS
jgi:large subunit GTPase 1